MEIVRKRPLTKEPSAGPVSHGFPKQTIPSDNYSSYSQQPRQPFLVNSVTEDEEDQSIRNHPANRNRQTKHRHTEPCETKTEEPHRKALMYIDGYDAMLQQQDAEYLATSSHMLPLLRLLSDLAADHDDNEEKEETRLNPEDILLREISYRGIQRAVEVIESNEKYRFVTSDQQLMLVLHILTERNSNATQQQKGHKMQNSITWNEILQCYKICIIAMQTLEKVPNPKDIRDRVRERSLYMMSLFQPASNPRFYQDNDKSPVNSGKSFDARADNQWTRIVETVTDILETITKRENLLSKSHSSLLGHVAKLSAFAMLCLLCLGNLQGSLKGDAPAPVYHSALEPTWTYSSLPVRHSTTIGMPQTSKIKSSTAKSARATASASKLPGASSPKVRRTRNFQFEQSFEAMNDKAQAKHPENRSEPTPEDYSHQIRNDSNSGIAMIAISAGTVATCLSLVAPLLSNIPLSISTAVPPLVPVGATVVAATLVAHGIRDLVSHLLDIFRKIRKQQ